MNLCKRACLYSIRKKGKTLTLLAFLLVMATLMLTCLSIQSATETANANIKKALLGYFTINAKTLENGIPEDTVSQILDVDGLSGRYTLRSYTYHLLSSIRPRNFWQTFCSIWLISRSVRSRWKSLPPIRAADRISFTSASISLVVFRHRRR